MKVNVAESESFTLIKGARACIDKRDYAAAENYLREVAKRREEGNHEAAFLMSKVLEAKNQKAEAIRLSIEAMQLAHGNIEYMERFIDLTGDQTVNTFNPVINAAIEVCLLHPGDLCLWRMSRVWLTNLIQRPDFRAAFAQTIAVTDDIKDFRPVLTPYFLQGLRHIDIQTLDFERMVVHLRRHVLEDAAGVKTHMSKDDQVALGAALAHYCFRGEYIVGYTSDKEKGMADGLRAKAEAAELPSPAEVAALACYAPLHQLKNADAIEKAYAAHPVLGSVIEEQITEWRALNAAAKRFDSATPISKGVSQKVQAQYEESPYPRWDKFYTPNLLGGWKGSYAEFPFLKDIFADKKADVLTAGCGTGKEPVAIALCEPEAKITAVDLSRMSLAYAQSKAQKHGAHGITFMHGDILNLGALDRTFDMITCAGVLHHMENPLEGWRTLAKLLKPRGVMRVALYSKSARRNILAVQEAARKNGYTAEADSMRAFRRDSVQNLDKATLRKLSRSLDYYVLSMYRDLLFHAQERNYDLTEIAGMLDELGLEFAGFCNQGQMQNEFRHMFPYAQNMLDLKQWNNFEQKYPDSFGHMYQFWCRKKA